jgi:dTDP-4-dehydrorhamnose reductase
MPRLLLTGLSGFLGWNIARLKEPNWQIVGTVRTRSVQLPGIEVERLDLSDVVALQRLFKRVAPDAVIHAAARTDPNYCQGHRQEAWQQNVDVSAALAALCAARDIPLVFTSTDLVFDGLQPPYSEGDKPTPVNVYGASKAEAEQQVRAAHAGACICRMPLMFGEARIGAPSFVQPMLETAQQGGRLHLFTDEFRTPASARAVVQGLFLALEKAGGQLLHVGGAERISRCDFGHLLMRTFSLPANVVQPSLQCEMPMAAPRARDVSLDNSKARALGYDPWPLAAELDWLVGKL